MSVLQAVTAIFRSPDAAVMVAQSVQASDLAARQGQASIQRDVQRRHDQVQAVEAASPTADTAHKRSSARDPRGRSGSNLDILV